MSKVISNRLKTVMYVCVSVVIRVLDIAGWLDTWFAVYGDLLSLGVYSRLFLSKPRTPYRGIDVMATRTIRRGKRGKLTVVADDPAFDTGALLQDVIDGRVDGNLILAMLSLMPLEELLPKSGYVCDIEVRIMSPYRPGASVGTSAAVAVAVGMAINELLSDLGHKRVSAAQLAWNAWLAETAILDQQSGTQDQASATQKPGVRSIRVSEYPKTTVRLLRTIGDRVLMRLVESLITVEVGPHVSTVEHGRVIKEQEGKGPTSPELQRLRPLADRARKCLEDGDLVGYGQALKDNTEAQRQLCPGLIGPDHQRIIDLASKSKGCLGWKVNGAGGDGGSITLLFDSRRNAVAFYHRARKEFSGPEDDFVFFEHSLAA